MFQLSVEGSKASMLGSRAVGDCVSCWGFQKSGDLFGGPNQKDHSTLGSILESLILETPIWSRCKALAVCSVTLSVSLTHLRRPSRYPNVEALDLSCLGAAICLWGQKHS